jgi:hypothetical protein
MLLVTIRGENHMGKDKSIKLFEEKTIRTQWDAEVEKWYFAIVDVIAVLTGSSDPGAYWRKLKERLKKEGNETVTNCHGLKMEAADGKMRLTDVADTEQLLRLIQSVPSKKAEITTTDISRQSEPDSMNEHKKVARRGGSVAKAARVQYEKQTGKSAIISQNARDLKSIEEKDS